MSCGRQERLQLGRIGVETSGVGPSHCRASGDNRGSLESLGKKVLVDLYDLILKEKRQVSKEDLSFLQASYSGQLGQQSISIMLPVHDQADPVCPQAPFSYSPLLGPA
jgi:hypothetical protein